jgi:transposase
VSRQEARAASGRHLSRARRSALPHPHPLDIGLDVHHASLAVAYVAHDHGAEVMYLGTMGTRQGDIDPRSRQRPAKSQHRVLVDEAGPGGEWRSRYVTNTGVACGVVAPSVIPQTTGARVNTARRDAGQRARRRRSGDLTPVSGPQVEDEALRELSRARI